MIVEILGFINEHERKLPSNPLLDSLILQKRRRQSAWPVKFIQGGGVRVHLWRDQAPAPCGQRSGEYVEGLAIKAPAEDRIFAEATVEAAARAIHEGERQNFVPIAQHAVLYEFARAAHEIKGLARARRTLKEIECHVGANRKTFMAAVESAGMRAKSGASAFAGSRSTAHKALSNCSVRTRQSAFAMSVTAALSWVGA